MHTCISIYDKHHTLTLSRNFTSPNIVRIESGIGHMWEQYQRNEKLQKLMGKDNPPPVLPGVAGGGGNAGGKGPGKK